MTRPDYGLNFIWNAWLKPKTNPNPLLNYSICNLEFYQDLHYSMDSLTGVCRRCGAWAHHCRVGPSALMAEMRFQAPQPPTDTSRRKICILRVSSVDCWMGELFIENPYYFLLNFRGYSFYSPIQAILQWIGKIKPHVIYPMVENLVDFFSKISHILSYPTYSRSLHTFYASYNDIPFSFIQFKTI